MFPERVEFVVTAVQVDVAVIVYEDVRQVVLVEFLIAEFEHAAILPGSADLVGNEAELAAVLLILRSSAFRIVHPLPDFTARITARDAYGVLLVFEGVGTGRYVGIPGSAVAHHAGVDEVGARVVGQLLVEDQDVVIGEGRGEDLPFPAVSRPDRSIGIGGNRVEQPDAESFVRATADFYGIHQAGFVRIFFYRLTRVQQVRYIVITRGCTTDPARIKQSPAREQFDPFLEERPSLIVDDFESADVLDLVVALYLRKVGKQGQVEGEALVDPVLEVRTAGVTVAVIVGALSVLAQARLVLAVDGQIGCKGKSQGRFDIGQSDQGAPIHHAVPLVFLGQRPLIIFPVAPDQTGKLQCPFLFVGRRETQRGIRNPDFHRPAFVMQLNRALPDRIKGEIIRIRFRLYTGGRHFKHVAFLPLVVGVQADPERIGVQVIPFIAITQLMQDTVG